MCAFNLYCVFFCIISWILLLIFQDGQGLEIEEVQDELEVTISRGALVTPVSNVILYTDMETLIFTIPGRLVFNIYIYYLFFYKMRAS